MRRRTVRKALICHVISSYVVMFTLVGAAKLNGENVRGIMGVAVAAPLGFPFQLFFGGATPPSSWVMLAVVYAVPFAVAWFVCTFFENLHGLRRQLYSGTCEKCGYDLRASPDRCPECGTIRLDRTSRGT
jgi:hypothetical protein